MSLPSTVNFSGVHAFPNLNILSVMPIFFVFVIYLVINSQMSNSGIRTCCEMCSLYSSVVGLNISVEIWLFALSASEFWVFLFLSNILKLSREYFFPEKL